VTAGSARQCTTEDIEVALSVGGVTALLVVESRLCRGDNPTTREAVEVAHRAGLPVILDGAAQDLRLSELVASGADLILISAQKYLSAPTAGIVLGRRDLVDAVRNQVYGIGRGMKAGKEAIVGAMAALEYRQSLDLETWARDRKRDAQDFADSLNRIPAISAELVRDPTDGPFWRVHARIDEAIAAISARRLAEELGKGDPPIFVFEQDTGDGILNFELLALSIQERALIIERVEDVLRRPYSE
jgi:L-seryl-tRNA(Ser) seleniumtransferase